MRPNVREHPISVHRNRLDIEEWDAVVDAVLDAVRDAVRDAMRDANYNEVNVGMGSAPEKSFPSDSSGTLVRTLVESGTDTIFPHVVHRTSAIKSAPTLCTSLPE